MGVPILGTLAVILYLLGAAQQFSELTRGQAPPPWRRALLTWLALLTHGGAVAGLLFPGGQLDLGVFQIATLMAWTMVAVMVVLGLRRPLDTLFVVLFPLAALSLTAALSVESRYVAPSDPAPGFALHVLLALLAYSVLTVAAAQSLFLAWQERALRRRQARWVLKALPPLQTMETVLFECVALGLLLLTLTLGTGMLFLEDLFAQQVVHHTVLSIASWVVFAILLLGRHRLGWRGRTAIRWTLSGFFLLVLAYFGSKVVLEVILGA
jgi:ABC-type uncharacterized transport system permease subunit